jgi:hypothetical protein
MDHPGRSLRWPYSGSRAGCVLRALLAAQCQQLFVGGVTYPVHNWPQSCTIVAAAPPPEACWEGWGSPLGWWARRWGGRERAEEHVARTKIYDR